VPVGAAARAGASQHPRLTQHWHNGGVPILWLALLSPLVLLLLMLAMERVEGGLVEEEPQAHAPQ
jgi:hypothetical protein